MINCEYCEVQDETTPATHVLRFRHNPTLKPLNACVDCAADSDTETTICEPLSPLKLAFEAFEADPSATNWKAMHKAMTAHQDAHHDARERRAFYASQVRDEQASELLNGA